MLYNRKVHFYFVRLSSMLSFLSASAYRLSVALFTTQVTECVGDSFPTSSFYVQYHDLPSLMEEDIGSPPFVSSVLTAAEKPKLWLGVGMRRIEHRRNRHHTIIAIFVRSAC